MIRWVLVRMVLIGLSYLAVSAALATIPGRAINYWYLYYSPVVMAALSFGLIGALAGSGVAIASLITFLVRFDIALREAGLTLVRQVGANNNALLRELEQRVFQWDTTGIITSSGISLEVRSVRDTFFQALFGVIIITFISCLVGWLVDQNRRRNTWYEEQAGKDGLTGLPNYRRLMEFLSEQVMRGQRFGHSFTYLMIDVDGLKVFNDSYGHRTGDAILTEIGCRLKSVIREQVDMVARYGGDEFAVVLAETNPDGIAVIAERLRKAIEATPITVGQLTAHLTISVGAAIYPIDGANSDQLIESADAALYKSKLGGKNAITLALVSSDPERRDLS